MRRLCLLVFMALLVSLPTQAQKHYYAHDAVEDRYGVIAPWYKGQNGQYDLRVRIAAETIKRYPWVATDRAVSAAPEYVYNGSWSIDPAGTITVVPETDWNYGDVGQRGAYIMSSMIDYYRYSGDPAAFRIIAATANYLISHCETPVGHRWPGILISVPTKGVRQQDCTLGPSDDLKSGNGKIQLDIVGEVGWQLVRAYEMSGDVRWFDAAKHWADLLAENRRQDPGASPWGRYVDNQERGMNGVQTGGVVYILMFLDELIRAGHLGSGGEIVEARDAAREYLKTVLLPAWTIADTWGRNYWDWEEPDQAENVSHYLADYMMDHKDIFPNWKNDLRNILSLFLNHTSVNPESNSDTFSGAWAFPESSTCCHRSLWYAPMELATVLARYGAEANSEWGRELARRSQLLATYDILPNGQSQDLIDGGSDVSKTWFKIAHPEALKHVLSTMSWLPEVMGANRENHILRSSSVVKQVVYGKDHISYSTFDAPAESIDVLRLSYLPTSVTADGNTIPVRQDLAGVGYSIHSLNGGDFIVTLRHDGATELVVTGPDPQSVVDDKQMSFGKNWRVSLDPGDYTGGSHVATQAGASVSYSFIGNQVRLFGRVGPNGGLADIYIDGTRQLAPIDCYAPSLVHQQILFYMNGISNGSHTIKIVLRGTYDPMSAGTEVDVDGIQFSGATGDSGFGEGGGSVESQRMIFGYTGRADYVDSKGGTWRPATEFIARTGDLTDVVAKTWWTMRQAVFIENATDPELYRYGVHWTDFTTNITVGPGVYRTCLKFAETEFATPNQRIMTIYVNGEKVVEGYDVFAAAGDANKAVDLTFSHIHPQNGVISIRLVGSRTAGVSHEAMIQALEVSREEGETQVNLGEKLFSGKLDAKP